MAFDKLSPAFQKDMVDLIFRLQDQVKPIRVYLAVETKSGPLNGLATQIEETANLPILDDIPSSEIESVSSNADPMPSHVRALQGKEKARGAEHTPTLDDFGDLFAHQGKMADAVATYLWALQAKEKAWGPDHTSTLDTVSNLGNLYADQGEVAEAEAMYVRALQGYKA